MSLIIKCYRPGNFGFTCNIKSWRYNSNRAAPVQNNDDEEEFRVLDITKKRDRMQRREPRKTNVQPDRTDRMSPDQPWGNVWPGPKTFHPSSVPLPLRQGYVPKGQSPPGKKANAELMKIPNFLHLTPPVIKMQCEAIKKFCTPWPSLLNCEEAIEKHYPVEVITSDYCHASPSIRNPLARIVNLRFKLATLKLDQHARDKFIRLVGDKYDEETDYVTLTSDRCPVRQQNLDYVNYLLTACYHESWNLEDWEGEKTEEDMEFYNWDNNPSKISLVNWYLKSKNETADLTKKDYKNFDISVIDNSEGYKNAVSNLMNDGESDETIQSYGAAVRKLFGLPERKIVD